MGYPEIVDALHATIAGITELVQEDEGGNPTNVLKYEPQALHTSPVVYMILSRVDEDNQLGTKWYEINVRLCIKWQDNEGAELELIGLVDAIPDAIRANRELALTANLVLVPEGEALYANIGDALCRVVDWTVRVKRTATS